MGTRIVAATCENCGEPYDIQGPDRNGDGVAAGGKNCIFVPETGVVHPFCPKCRVMDMAQYVPFPTLDTPEGSDG